MQKIFKIDLDIKNPQLKSVPPIEVVSGDTSTNIFNINLLENFKEVNASGNTAVITFVKSDGTTVFQNLTAVNASKGQYTCTLSSQTIVVPGRVKAEVSLYEGTKRLTSVRFEFNVRKALLDDDTVESSNEFSALTEALADVEEMKDEVLNNLNTASLSLSTADSIKSVTANVGSVPKVRIESNIANNILGNKGNCESLSDWKLGGISPTLDTSKKMFGNASFRYVKNSQNGYIYEDFANIGLNKYYVLSWWINIEVALSGRNNVYLSDYNTHNNAIEVASASALTNGKPLNTWIRIGAKFESTKEKARLAMFGGGDTGIGTYNFDGIMLQEITTDDYNNLTVDQLMAKYPYVNGVQPLLNPCLTVRGKNLTKEFAKPWGYALANGAYPVNADRYISTDKIKIKPNSNCVFSTPDTLGNATTVLLFWKSGIFVGYNSIGANFTGSYSFTKDADEMVVSTGNTAAPAPSFSLRIQLEEGTVATPYEPYREKQRIYPCTLGKVGEYADEIEDDGIKAVKTWRTKKYVLQAEDITSMFTSGINLDYAKVKKPTNYIGYGKFTSGDYIITGYPNKLYKDDASNIGTSNSNADGNMFFVGFSKGITLQQAQAALAGTEIWYVLATPEQEIIEPIGSLRLEEGYNCIDVSSGIVYEKANPVAGSVYNINNINVPGSLLKYKVNKIIGIFKNKILDTKWNIVPGLANAYGKELATLLLPDFDSTATYTAKYEVLHEDYNSQQVQVTMEYADNLRTSHNQLVENVAGLESEVNDIWFALLPIADKEIAMQRIALLTTETTADLKAKVNEILNVWR